MIQKLHKKYITYILLFTTISIIATLFFIYSSVLHTPDAAVTLYETLPMITSNPGVNLAWSYNFKQEIEEPKQEVNLNTTNELTIVEQAPEATKSDYPKQDLDDSNRYFITRGGSEHIAPSEDLTKNLMGIDISHYQSDVAAIDWSKVKKSGVSFVFTKITEGTSYQDPYASRHINGAQSVQIPIGGYHFARPNFPLQEDAEMEAAFFMQQLEAVFGSNNYGDLVAVLDFEAPSTSSSLESKDLLEWATYFCSYFEKNTGHKIIIYTGNWFIDIWDDFYGKNNPLQDYPLWLADYYSNSIPSGAWSEWLIWQFSDKGEIDGIYGAVDLNIGPLDISYLKP